eukprot:TRINITY_DN8720_c0_g1_i2.p1 TRINITY_DN8720_c0_g1~~TRINITY_DN8720_c0_g1_i2.p1  ORF type:complete len:490 (+),score=87.69 TRINITY_DN8720_c0_g1_i2:331-1800(+)
MSARWVSTPAKPSNPLKKNDNIEIELLAGNGDLSNNRIDVVLMGDGYTQQQKSDFDADMRRLVDDMFDDVTFQSYLPVFNIWSIYIPSAESGIGTHGQPRDTTFGLYRDGTQLRGIYTSKPAAARSACSQAPGCDFPSMIGNDDYYGGLGGEFVIGTKSLTTGTVVLRHEMGHNFVNVGEEYDDGSVYSGVNSDNTRTNIKWSHWLTEPETTIPEQKAIQRLGVYPWADLAHGPQTFRFTSNGDYNRWFMRFTLSGCNLEGSISVELDGRQLHWEPAKPLGEVTLDRQFYTYSDMENGFSAGEHVLTIRMLIPPPAGTPIRQLCSLSLNEYGAEDTFKWDQRDFVGAYPTWDVRGRKTYRPQNEVCLMRNMTSPNFCVACKEGMWWQFFMRMSAIDDIVVEHHLLRTHVKVETVELGQFRKEPIVGLNDRFDITWTHNNVPYPDLTGYFSWDLATTEARGTWVATVTYHTDEVRIDPNNLLTFTKSFTV